MYRDLGCDYTFTGLSPGHLFRIRLAAVSDGGTSEVSFTTVFDEVLTYLAVAQFQSASDSCIVVMMLTAFMFPFSGPK